MNNCEGIKVLIVSPTYSGGGAEKIARQLYQKIPEKGIETFFVAGRYDPNCPEGIKVIYHSFMGRAITALKGMANNNVLNKAGYGRKSIVELIEKNHINIVHFHNIRGNYIGLKDIKYIRRACPNIIITMHDMWLLTGCCPHGMSCEKWQRKAEGHLECQFCRGNEALSKGDKRAARYLQWKKEALQRKGIHFVCPSKWLINQCERSYLGENKENIHLIPNGVDISRFRVHDKEIVRKKYDIPQDKRVLIFSAHNTGSPYKGFKFLVEALRQLQNKEEYFLLILGKMNADKEIFNEMPFSVKEMGYVSDEEKMSELYSAADLFLLPSLADTFPLVMLEAMASGTPVLASETGGIPEAVTADVGWIVPAGNSVQMHQKIEEIFNFPEELCKKSSYCREHVEKLYSEEIMIAHYRELYSGCF